MTGNRKFVLIALTLLLSAAAERVWAFDLNGAWAGDAQNCGKIFTRKDSQTVFSDNSDIYGGGFVIEGDQMIGKSGRCRIKARKDDGANVHLVAACASEITFQNMQFSLKGNRCQYHASVLFRNG